MIYKNCGILYKDVSEKQRKEFIMSIYDILLFDLDGTLTDPKIGITKSVQYALSKFNIKEENLDNLEKFIGPPLMESFCDFYSFKEQEAVKAVQYYREYFSIKGIYENVLYPKIPELLIKLKNLNKKKIVATSKPTIFAEKILKHFKIYHHFSSVIGSNLDGTRTSKTEIIKFILSKLPDVKKENIVMIGDRKHDVIGAKNNGIHSIAVSYGYGTIEELINVNPTYIAGSVEELFELLC